jgi:hypothetical protein
MQKSSSMNMYEWTVIVYPKELCRISRCKMTQKKMGGFILDGMGQELTLLLLMVNMWNLKYEWTVCLGIY